jgi:diacylglycerol kinase (ATP)
VGPSARLIANPSAGADEAASQLGKLRRRLSADYALDVVVTEGTGDAYEAAMGSARRGDSRLFVAGGDGTLNEAINGLWSIDGALARTAIGLVPTGTCNDFAAALGLPADVDAALEAFTTGTVRMVDLGEVNGRVFVNVSAGGFIAEVSAAVDPALKDVAGRLAFLLGGAKVLFTTEPFRCRVHGPEVGSMARDCMLFAVCNAQTIGGGRMIAPRAQIDDRMLDVCLVGGMELPRFVNVLRQIANGTHTDHPDVEYFRISALEMEFERDVHVNTDGEVFRTGRCAYGVLPHAARFLVPDAP